jgi:preprotein translocase subunit SecD
MIATRQWNLIQALTPSLLVSMVAATLVTTGCAPKSAEPSTPIAQESGQVAIDEAADPAPTTPDASAVAAPRPKVTVHLASVEPHPGYTQGEARGWKTVYIAPEVVLTDDDFLSAEAVDDRFGPVVNVTLTPEGGKKMAAFTRAHIGELVATQVDGTLMNAAKIMSVVSSSIQITGDWDKEEATRLAKALNP